jgi:hypothetical protein
VPLKVELADALIAPAIVTVIVQLATSDPTPVPRFHVYSLLPAPAFALHDWLASTVMVKLAPLIVALIAQLLVGLTVPPADVAEGRFLTCNNHGLADVAVHVTSGLLSTVPDGLTLHLPPPSPSDRLVILNCVVVPLTYPAMVDVVQLTVEPSVGIASSALVEDAIQSELGNVSGVMNGDTVLVPLEAVMFGVANAGDATTINTDASTSNISTLLRRKFMAILYVVRQRKAP